MENNNYIENVFLVHTGNSEYLEISLKRIRNTNPNINIILLGDTENDKYNFIRHALIGDYNTYSKKFEKIYIHLSDKEYKYELFCFQRWFIILEYMKKHNIDKAYYQDSDVIIDCDLTQIEYDNKFWYSECSGHTCMFTIELLEELCKLILNYYTDESNLLELINMRSHMKHIEENDKWTNVTDMELISLYVYNNRQVSRDVSRINEINGIFGLNINAEDYSNAFNMKKYDFLGSKTKLYLIKGKLYAKESIINKFVRILAVHFHSDNKRYMSKFIKYPKAQNNNIFYYDFEREVWVEEEQESKRDLIDYKLIKETFIHLEQFNHENIVGMSVIRDFSMCEQIDEQILNSNIYNCSKEKYIKLENELQLSDKTIIGWGCGNGYNLLKQYYDIKISYFVDKDEKKIGTKKDNINIYHPQKIFREKLDKIFIIILSISYYLSIKNYLEECGLKENIQFISLEKLLGYYSKKIDLGV